MWAMRNCHMVVVAMLLKHHAQVDLQDTVCTIMRYRMVFRTILKIYDLLSLCVL